jgi:hypothetical protein
MSVFLLLPKRAILSLNFFLRRAPQRMLRTHRSPKAYCATLWWRWRERWVFKFFQVMEHRWNAINRGKPKYSGKSLSQFHFVHDKSHVYWPGIEPGPAVGGRRLTAWAMARPIFSVNTVLTIVIEGNESCCFCLCYCVTSSALNPNILVALYSFNLCLKNNSYV